MYNRFFKRVFDFYVALLLMIFFSVFFLIVLFILLISNSGKVFFTQDRPGKNGKIFKVIKFKTMNNSRDANGVLLPDSQRLTKVGKFIRSTSLDEIPQLLNILKGDMSLVGPRPLLVSYLNLYTPEQNKRHNVRPGITGWAQVNGRNSISWTQKFEYDVWYVDNISFFLDIKILCLTLKKVIKREGISSNNNATMEAFKGNN